MLPKINAYDGQMKWMYFLIKCDSLLEKYSQGRYKKII